MVDAYFSGLEHYLILLRAFCGRPLSKGELLEFIALPWSEKFKAMVDVTEPATQLCYARLKTLKERIRNPLAHGGIENDGSSFYIHMPELGALPATFTKIRESARFNLMPIEPEDYITACQLFDEIDHILSSGELARPYRFMKDGIDPAFDPDTIRQYKEAIVSDDEADAYIEYWSREWERHANMEY